MRHELYSPVPEESLDNLIEIYIDTFLKEGYITQNEDMLYISGDGFNEFSILSRTIRPHLIRFLVAGTALKQIEDGTMNVDAFIKKCIDLSKRLSSYVTENSPDFADPILFKIICHTFIRHKYFEVLEDGTIKKNLPKVEKLLRAAEPLLAAREVQALTGRKVRGNLIKQQTAS